jgi:hypothetical protein
MGNYLIGRLLFTLGPLSLLFGIGPAHAMSCPGVALVLAIDASSSVDDLEYDLQMRATAMALVDPEVVIGMQSVGGVALAAVIWGDSATGTQIVDWHLVASMRQAQVFAGTLAAQPRLVGGNTDLGHGIDRALDLFELWDGCATRQVIDVSGDGRETLYARSRIMSLPEARQRAQDMGVQINGLAIATEDLDLADYYLTRMIVGEGAFVMNVTGLHAFQDAMEQKLLREIGNPFMLAAASDP